MEGMSALVVKAKTVDGIGRVKLDAAGVDEIGERIDHSLPFELGFVTGTGGKPDKRRAPMAVNNDAKLHAEAMGIPAMIVALHGIPFRCQRVRTRQARVCQPKSGKAIGRALAQSSRWAFRAGGHKRSSFRTRSWVRIWAEWRRQKRPDKGAHDGLECPIETKPGKHLLHADLLPKGLHVESGD